MTLLLATTIAALILGTFLPLRWGVFGFLAAAALLFLTQAAIHTLMGFEGTPLSETMLLFNNSWPAYIGYNLQITVRSFALPLLALSTPLIFRMGRRA
ncbi:hypothetical protein [Tateyamaria sp. ANG-S1]|uniref:hypothetical protein n=1 Tax=Tateyamaria sp. ANG-S1 TaxID=1577905 RepID=UPI0005802C68|nr:hypothetical protein [Tateyamaria sp. ANG-S1]KIC51768.1 hypothetical protein RA29_00165 [Tateyamaria sp. ANG-S1]